jgi:hypothetical protein
MKHLVVVAALVSLLVPPVAFSQSAPQPAWTPSETTAKAAVKDVDFYEPPRRTSSESAMGSLGEAEGADSQSDAQSTVKGSFEGSEPTDVKTTFEDADTGS